MLFRSIAGAIAASRSVHYIPYLAHVVSVVQVCGAGEMGICDARVCIICVWLVDFRFQPE